MYKFWDGYEIARFLHSKGFVISDVGQSFFSPPFFGMVIRYVEDKNCIDILIGLNN
jgi:hypothetical protein